MKNARMVLIAATIVFLCAHALFAQGPDTQWTRTYGGVNDDQAYSVQQTYDGGYIIAGYTESFGAGHGDIYLVRTDSIGDTLWTRTYGDTMVDIAYSVQQTPDSGFIVAGQRTSPNPPWYNTYAYLLKTDKNGDSLWARLNGSYHLAKFYSVNLTSDSGYIAVGYTFPENPRQGDMIFLVKIDKYGSSWSRECCEGHGYWVNQITEGGYIVAATIPAGSNNANACLLKTYPNGDTIWTKNYGGAEDDFGYSVALSADNGYIVVGETFSGAGWTDVYAIGTDSLGDTLWTRTYGETDYEGAFSIQGTFDSHYITTGYTKSFGSGLEDVYLLKMDENGDTIWTRAYGWAEADAGYCGQQTADSGYIVAGYTRSFGAGDWDFLLLKTQPDVGIEEKKEPKEIKQDIRFFTHPNPFTTTSVITILGISENQNIRESELKIFDLSGRKVREISLLPFNFSLRVTWDGKDSNGIEVPGGIYLVRLQAGDHTSVHKVVLLR